jgi:AAA15 family ATPase/GTPase
LHPTSFAVKFIAEEIEYDYGFEILQGEVVKEYLYKRGSRKTPIFIRNSPDHKDIKVFTDLKRLSGLKKYARRDNLFLYHARAGNNKIAQIIYDWFDNVLIFGNDYDFNLDPTFDYIKNDKNRKNSVLNFIKDADIQINDIHLKEHTQNDVPSFEVIQSGDIINPTFTFKTKRSTLTIRDILITHKNYDQDWNRIADMVTTIYTESAGTIKFVELTGPIVEALESGKIIFIDEIDARLHPLLVKFLVMFFNSNFDNPTKAQLICNTHVPILLEESFRRDQIYFVNKDDYGRSSLYSLFNFKGVRKNDKFLKRYLLGAYGAIPKT